MKGFNLSVVVTVLINNSENYCSFFLSFPNFWINTKIKFSFIKTRLLLGIIIKYITIKELYSIAESFLTIKVRKSERKRKKNEDDNHFKNITVVVHFYTFIFPFRKYAQPYYNIIKLKYAQPYYNIIKLTAFSKIHSFWYVPR